MIAGGRRGYCALALSSRAEPAAVFPGRALVFSDSVLAVTLTRLAESGFSVATLEPAYDVYRPRTSSACAQSSPSPARLPGLSEGDRARLEGLKREGAL